MGIYIEASNGLKKEEWLKKYGTVTESLTWEGQDKEYYPVCLVDNGAFKAALVCWLESEVLRVHRSLYDGDPQPMTFYQVRKEDLRRALGEGTWNAMMQDIEDGAE